ncbi:baeRF12 domain-containing protein [Porphyrobacter sp. LM 6]|uniref:baeRF12 domain-containing protein n=1 Tax=Porphyrobacter sp. LM 6 TaxID=1896196 RepID=UPI000847B5F7|nr:host attachment family protein [Porphyrobacter sp. LM 6]AOL93606.1 cell attachment protein [Porphyrobacter sp. LM 6]
MKVEHGTLVMVADGAKLLLLRNEGDTKYPVLQTVMHERQGNPAAHEQGTDAPGRSFASTGEARSSYEETDWHRQAEDAFARHAAAVLERSAASHPEAGIVVIAAPRTLGEMRRHYGRATKARLLAEIAKDLADHPTDDMIAALAAHGEP